MSKLYRFLISLLLLTLTSLGLKAEVFTVTSNADAGVGTLREALTKAAANGSAEKDFIHFNLPDQSEAGRTITLLSQLPNVSSNLDIDGSTQPGNVFGVSTAKILLAFSFSSFTTYFGFTLINVNDVGLYGMYMKNVYSGNLSNIGWSNLHGVLMRASKNINIGAEGRGNVIYGFSQHISANANLTGRPTYIENLVIKSTFIGLDADGITRHPQATGQLQFSYVYGNVVIGGNVNEGNVIPNGITFFQENSGLSDDPLYNSHATLHIKNNKIGTDYTGKQDFSNSGGLQISTSSSLGQNTVYIEDNVISSSNYGIYIINNGKPVYIKRNYIGIDKGLTKQLLVRTGVFIYYADGVNIGSSDPADANYIAYCKPVQVWPNASATVNKNSFFCTTNAFPMISNGGTRSVPVVEITNATATSVTGTATPNSEIELFYSDLCGTCSPETYFASTTADANGNWSYTGTILRSVIASATLNGSTSEFTRTRIDVTGIRTVNTCSNTGSIIGALPMSAQYVQWLDENDNVVGNGANLLNVPPGKYKLKAVSGDCSETTPFYEIRKGLVLNGNNIQTTNAACGTGGSIRNLQVVNNTTTPTVYSWKNEGGIEVGTTQNLLNVPAGTYTLTIRTTDNSCIETYRPITLTNVSGPNISLSSLNITGANCGTNTGSITGIIATGSGTISYRWKNENGAQVGTTRDLINQPPGRYTLEITDQSSCGAVSTSPITILESNGITISDTQKQIFNPTCVGNNGSVKGLQITGATSYTWKNSNGQIVGTQANLEGMPPGVYQLTASNLFCSKIYDVTLTAQPNLINFQGTTKTITDASCGLNNGKILVTLQNVVRLPKSYRWEDKEGRTVGGNTNVLENVDAGEYSIYGKDDNDCEIFIATYTINRQSVLSFSSSNYRVVHDNCNQRLGSISGLQISGGLAPYAYKWTNEAGVQVGSTLNVSNLPKGNYTLQITDALNCTPLQASYTINNQTQQVAAPTVTPIQLCAPGEATLRVSGLSAATSFALYANEQVMLPLDISTNGVFKIDAGGDKTYFVAQRVGECESERVEVKVTVGLSGLTISNTITPNNDGINDVWNLKGIENYPKAHIQIFNRAGNKVYETFGYKTPFDGTNNGAVLPVGVYYYVIKLDVACELVTGTLTIIR